MPTIEVKNLKKYFGEVKAVDGISFNVEAGEIFGFLGPNGAGKTTTIRCLMDFIRPTEGEIKILDKDLKTDGVAIKKEMAYLPATPQFYANWTGNDHIKFVKKMREDKETFADALVKKFDFNPNVKTKNLSTGNRQKLGLILALLSAPKVLILDEPTSGLDPILQNEIYLILEDLAKKGTTIFMSSHNLHEVGRICGKVAIIKEGKLIAEKGIADFKKKGDLEEVFLEYYKKGVSDD